MRAGALRRGNGVRAARRAARRAYPPRAARGRQPRREPSREPVAAHVRRLARGGRAPGPCEHLRVARPDRSTHAGQSRRGHAPSLGEPGHARSPAGILRLLPRPTATAAAARLRRLVRGRRSARRALPAERKLGPAARHPGLGRDGVHGHQRAGRGEHHPEAGLPRRPGRLGRRRAFCGPRTPDRARGVRHL